MIYNYNNVITSLHFKSHHVRVPVMFVTREILFNFQYIIIIPVFLIHVKDFKTSVKYLL